MDVEDKVQVKKNTLWVIGIVIFIILTGYFVLSKGNDVGNGDNGGIVNQGDGVSQNIFIGMKNSNYYPNTIKVEVGKTVRISLDKSVTGCFRSFTIKDFGISKYLASPNDYVEFIPTKKGTFRFACSMGMGTGTIIVE